MTNTKCERRRRALISLGRKTAPCIIVDLNDLEATDLIAIENVQKLMFSPWEEGKLYYKMWKEQGKSQTSIGKSIGMSHDYVSDRIQLYLKFKPDLGKKIRASGGPEVSSPQTLTVDKALHITKFPDKVKDAFVSKIEMDGLSDDEVRREARNFEKKEALIRNAEESDEKKKLLKKLEENPIEIIAMTTESISEVLYPEKESTFDFETWVTEQLPKLLELGIQSKTDRKIKWEPIKYFPETRRFIIEGKIVDEDS